MIKKYSLLFLLLYPLISITDAYAQQFKFRLERIDIPESARKNFGYGIVTGDSNTFYLNYYLNNSKVFQFFNANMKSIGDFEVETPDVDGKPADKVEYYYNNEKLYCFYSRYNKGKDMISIFCRTFDRTGKVLQDGIKLLESKVEKKYEKEYFDIYFSPNSKKIMIKLTPNHRSKENLTLRYKLVNSELDLIADKDVELPYSIKQTGYTSYILDNNGAVILLHQSYYSKEEISSNPSLQYATRYDFYNLDPETGITKEIQFAGQGQYIHTLTHTLDPRSGRLAFAGSYFATSADNKGRGEEGIFYFELDPANFSLRNRKFSAFTAEMRNEANLLNTKHSRKDQDAKIDQELPLTHCSLLGTYFMENGDLKMVYESQNRFQECDTRSDGSMRCIWHYQYNHILEFTIDTFGNMTHVFSIPKIQELLDSDGGSAMALNSGKQLFYVYNDALKNSDKNKVDKKVADEYYFEFNGNPKQSLMVVVSEDLKTSQRLKNALTIDPETHFTVSTFTPAKLDPRTLVSFVVQKKTDKEVILVKFSLY